MTTPTADQITMVYLANLAAVIDIAAESIGRALTESYTGEMSPEDAAAIVAETIATIQTAAKP